MFRCDKYAHKHNQGVSKYVFTDKPLVFGKIRLYTGFEDTMT